MKIKINDFLAPCNRPVDLITRNPTVTGQPNITKQTYTFLTHPLPPQPSHPSKPPVSIPNPINQFLSSGGGSIPAQGGSYIPDGEPPPSPPPPPFPPLAAATC